MTFSGGTKYSFESDFYKFSALCYAVEMIWRMKFETKFTQSR